MALLEAGVEPIQSPTEDQKADLVKKYLEFKELMNKIDKDDEEEDEDGNPIPAASSSGYATPSKPRSSGVNDSYSSNHNSGTAASVTGQRWRPWRRRRATTSCLP